MTPMGAKPEPTVLPVDQCQALADLLQPIGHRHRLLILAAVADRVRCCSDLVNLLRPIWPTVTQPGVSHHTALLVASGWLRSERRARNVWYTPGPNWSALVNALETIRPRETPDDQHTR